MGPDFRFYVLFSISDKNKEFDISQDVLNLFIAKIKNFYPLFTVLPDLTKLDIASKRAVGEKKQRHIQFQDEKLHFFKCKF